MTMILHLLPTLFGFKPILKHEDDPWTPQSTLLDILRGLERPKPVHNAGGAAAPEPELCHSAVPTESLEK